MIQFNLLPDVKVEFVKAQQMKRLVLGVAIIATGSTFAIFLVLFLTVHGVQQKSMNDLSTDIKKYSTQLQNTKDLNKVLTIQNQLSSLTALHDQKAAALRQFTYIQQITPADLRISDYATDFTANTMVITGTAPTLARVDTFVDTLKFATYTDGTATATQKAFSSVVLAQFGKADTGTTYTINLSFDPTLFRNDSDKNLVVPSTVTTRSVVELPADLFVKPSGSATTSSSQTNTGNQ